MGRLTQHRGVVRHGSARRVESNVIIGVCTLHYNNNNSNTRSSHASSMHKRTHAPSRRHMQHIRSRRLWRAVGHGDSQQHTKGPRYAPACTRVLIYTDTHTHILLHTPQRLVFATTHAVVVANLTCKQPPPGRARARALHAALRQSVARCQACRLRAGQQRCPTWTARRPRRMLAAMRAPA